MVFPYVFAKSDPAILAIVIGTMVVVLVIGAALAHRANKRRLEGISATLSGAGFEVAIQKKDPRHFENFSRMGPFLSLRTGADGVRWSATNAGSGITLLEHVYTTGAGKSRQTHYHTITCVSCPPSWRSLSIEPEGIFAKIAEMFGSRDIKVEDEAFNKRWRVKCDSEDFALLVLTPQIQAWFQSLPKGVMVRVGGGGLAVFRRAIVKPTELTAFAGLAPSLRAMIPPDVDAFSG